MASDEGNSVYSRTFEFKDDKSQKFWEVTCNHCDMTTRWGRIDSSGQSKTKTFDTHSDALAAAKKAVAQKVKKGYVETSDAESPDAGQPTVDKSAALDEKVESSVTAIEAIESSTAEADSDQALATVDEEITGAPAPPMLNMVAAGMSAFDETSAIGVATSQALVAGFHPCGDFLIEELNVTVRGLYKSPAMFVAMCQLSEIEWIDVCIFNDDETYESWSSQTIHDGRVPPWGTLHRMPNAGFEELLQSSEQHSGKPLAQLAADQFAEVFCSSYSREMEWRDQNPANTDLLTQLVQTFARDVEEEDPPKQPSAPPEDLSKTDLEAFSLLRIAKDSFSYAGYLCLSQIGKLEKAHKKLPLSQQGMKYVREARKIALQPHFTMNVDDVIGSARLDLLLGEEGIRIPLKEGEVWSDAMIADLLAMPEDRKLAWLSLIRHCLSGSASKPSAKWNRDAEPLLQQLPDFYECIYKWMPLIDKPKLAGEHDRYWDHPYYLTEGHQLVLRGLVWCCGLKPDEGLPALLTKIAVSAYRKIPEQGERATKLGNACVVIIGAMDHPDAVSMLAIIKAKARTKTTQKMVNRQLDKTAERLGVSRSELEEMSIPTFGLQQVGLLTEQLGDFTAELKVGAKKSLLQWRKEDGKLQKSVPASVKRDFADELKGLKTAVKEIDKMLTVQKQRIEGLYLEQTSWSFKDWRERYADHPLVGTLAGRLIWNLNSNNTCTATLWKDGELIDVDGNVVSVADDDRVSLWHPINESAATVEAWRRQLEATEFSQPFKQAHRELYVLTDAERQTETYSNRFAAHVLKQGQYRSLAQTRHWQVNYLGPWDGGDEGIAIRDIPQFNAKAQFWVSGAMAEEDDYGFSYVTTDQVRFFVETETEQPSNLADVPPVLFSEIMRDVDLFVGVASVGNDPNWSDGGPDGQFRDYWQSYSFGELSATAATRREVLERLLPRLKIADQCQLQERFLRVQGSLRAYKIHLGSGNILMEPNDQYLCIVTSHSTSAAEKLSLPFEGDNMFSIILSKAILLVDDTKIKDKTILSQIRTN